MQRRCIRARPSFPFSRKPAPSPPVLSSRRQQWQLAKFPSSSISSLSLCLSDSLAATKYDISVVAAAVAAVAVVVIVLALHGWVRVGGVPVLAVEGGGVVSSFEILREFPPSPSPPSPLSTHLMGSVVVVSGERGERSTRTASGVRARSREKEISHIALQQLPELL